jgi:hypothetical protein
MIATEVRREIGARDSRRAYDDRSPDLRRRGMARDWLSGAEILR